MRDLYFFNKETGGAKAPNWKGGKKKQWGYIVVFSPEHPSCVGKRRESLYVAEHRLVMEAHLGRLLAPHENVHHLNGVKDDNRLENLQLWARPQPSGQRVEDLVSWVFDNYNKEIRAKIEIEDLIHSVVARVSERA